MTRSSSLHARVWLGVACLVAAPGLVRAEDEEALEVDVRCAAQDDEGRAAARAEGVASILSLVPEVAFFARGPGAAAVHSAVAGCVKEVGQQERDGGEVALRFGAARGEVRQAVLNVVSPETTFARDEVLVVVPEQGLSPAEREVARKATTDALLTYRFRVRPLGAGSPPPLVCTVGGRIEAFDVPGGFHSLRLAGFSGRLYDKAAARVLAERAVESRRNVKELLLPGVVGEPVTGGAEERGARERLVGQAARAAVMGLVERLHDRSLPPDPSAPPPVELPPIPADAPKDQLHELRFVGWSEAEAEKVVAALARLEGGSFAGWERKGLDGERVVYRCAFRGALIVKQLKAGLAAAGAEGDVEKAGEVLTIRRR